MKIMSRIATELCQKEITLDDTFKIMMALKLSRMAQVTPTFDTFVDLIGYAEGWYNAQQEEKHINDAVAYIEKLVPTDAERINAQAKTITEYQKQISDMQQDFKKMREELKLKDEVIAKQTEHIKYLQGSATIKYAHMLDQQTASVIQQLENNGWKISR